MPGDSHSESSSPHEVPSQHVETSTERYGYERPDEVAQQYLDFKREMKEHYRNLKENRLKMTEFTEVYEDCMRYTAESITQVSSSETRDQIYEKLEKLALKAQKETYAKPPRGKR